AILRFVYTSQHCRRPIPENDCSRESRRRRCQSSSIRIGSASSSAASVTILFVSDFRLFLLSLVLTCVVLTWLAAASALHRRRLAAVPVRIHVAGSRGKTSTARLIGAALRFAGRRVLVKTTGTDPLLI